MPVKNVPLGQILLDLKLITPEQLNHALEAQKADPSKRIGDILVECGYITESEQMKALETRLKVPYLDLNGVEIDQEVTALLPVEIARKYNVIPVELNGRVLTIASSDPMNFYALDDVRLATNMEIKVMLSSGTDISNAIGHYYSQQQAKDAADDLSREFNPEAFRNDFKEMEEKIGNAPVVRVVSSMIQQAVKIGASDIHIEPMESGTRVRMRLDGVLQEQMRIPSAAHSAVVTRLKIMGGMNIAEKRVPQDGKVETSIDGKPVDLRLSSLPTVTGEKIVIRILGGTGAMLPLSQLGLFPQNEKLFETIIKNPHGIILVSGPTGSGKTTTLYALLNELNKVNTNIITVEDPVEYRMQGINQVQINTKAGLTFASGLRSILRQDPDIIMVGEIRDSETAQIAVRAAITGHLVLSTIHTNDAASTVTRLTDMGIEPYLVSSGVIGVIAQRLMRKICVHCSTAYEPNTSEQALLGIHSHTLLHKGTGCPYCNGTGYKGRTAVHEIMPMTKEMRAMVERRATDDEIRSFAVRTGTLSLREGCKKLVLSGVTTVEEMLKVTYNMG